MGQHQHAVTSNLNILVFVGSLRRNSYNRGLVNALLQSQQYKSSGITAHIPNLGQIPFFNQDYQDDKNIPQKVNDLVKLCIKSQLLLFVTPQYNGCMTPTVKNAYDWLTRPSPIYQNKVPAFGKKAAAMSTSYISQSQLQDCVKMGAYRKLQFLQQHYYINLSAKVFDQKSGKLQDKNQQQKVIQWGQKVVKFALKQQKQNKPKI